MQKRPIFDLILKRIQESRKFIQVLLGPRQVGKTTLALQVAEELDKPFYYVSADTATLQDLTWLQQQWEIARQKIVKDKGCVFIIDEVQKIPNWSSLIKMLWDEDTRNKTDLYVIILGSSPWLVQKGLTESLAGRFEIIPVTHWSFFEMNKIFGWSLDKYAYFGGYPGAVSLANEEDPSRWKNYINDSIIETTISRDILLMTQINKPVLLRRLFQLGCIYSGQILSYTKMLGQLQEGGNVTTIANYLDLLAGAGLLMGLQKYANQEVRQRGSSPKFTVFNNALMTAQTNKTFNQAKDDREFWGRLIESMVGAHLLNSIRGTQIELFYWREGDKEIDFVLKYGDKLTAIEVKSGYENFRRSGIDLFVNQFKPNRILLVGDKGMPIIDFLDIPITNLVE
ncbi:AAA family ATPase [Candidatus Babeliales bacterium]|nr:AAA family ATPase [Candidatus Babeliales bacterium]MCF7899772.1 AAA family ATPase [Candidatus Babeliales bacterium]